MLRTAPYPINELADAPWRTSTFSSGHGGACVEVASLGPWAAVRDSKNRDGGNLVFRAEAWADFLAATNSGIFDLG